MSNTKRSQIKISKRGVGNTGAFFLGALLIANLSACSSASTAVSPISSEKSLQTPANSRSTYCDVILHYLDQAVVAMGGAGTTVTADDLSKVLKESGDRLSGGFDVGMAGSQEMLDKLNDAGTRLLKIRVIVLSDGGDVNPDAKAFSADNAYLQNQCK